MVDYKPSDVNFIRSYDPYPEIDLSVIEKAAQMINDSVKPFALLGQGIELAGAREEVTALLEKAQIPFGTTILGLSDMPFDHPLNMYPVFVGMLLVNVAIVPAV